MNILTLFRRLVGFILFVPLFVFLIAIYVFSIILVWPLSLLTDAVFWCWDLDNNDKFKTKGPKNPGKGQATL